jgi:hypothetical protein
MKKIAIALLASLSAVAGAASAQTSENGITMTHDANVAAQIEQHARDVQAQPAIEEDAQSAADKTEKKHSTTARRQPRTRRKRHTPRSPANKRPGNAPTKKG